MDGLLPSAEEGDEYDVDDEGLREYLRDDMDPNPFDVQSDSSGEGRTSLSLSHSLSTVAAIEDLPDDLSQEAGPLVGGSSRPLPSSNRPLDPAVLEEVQRRKETHTLRPVAGGKGKFWKASELPFEVLSYVLPSSLLLPPSPSPRTPLTLDLAKRLSGWTGRFSAWPSDRSSATSSG